MEFRFEYLVYVVFALVIGSFAFKFIRHGGFKAAMFGAGIKDTIGEVSGNGPKLITSSLKVHQLEGAPEKAVGIEIIAKSVASYQMTPITLSITEAKKLKELLSTATNDKLST